jgi:peptidoglycan/xylan/chitin deacetylase (PgdA/CDA1 family)
MEIIRNGFHPVSSWQVVKALEAGMSLPERAVWVTFDDADPSVIEVALPILDRYDIPSTMFVCPGVVDTDDPYWWQVLERFVLEGLPYPSHLPVEDDSEALRLLKSVDDDMRRDAIAEMTAMMADAGIVLRHRQVSTEELQRYVRHGGTIGNHTWDHPCLNHCDVEEQQHQVIEAHQWLRERFPSQPPLFAYPNGNWARPTQQTLAELGYQLAVLFDHRLANPRWQAPLRLSRLMTNPELTVARYRAILGGVHPLVNRIRTAARARR